MITWIDLAEQQEMLAKAWTKRAAREQGRLRDAVLADAAEAAGMAADYRAASAAGATLHQGLALFLRVVP